MKKLLFWGGALLGATAVAHKTRQNRAISLEEKVVIITGASAGIGRAIAHAFAREGSHVVLVARRTQPLVQVQAELGRYSRLGQTTMVYPADVTDDDAIQKMIASVNDTFGQIDVLVNNAGLAVGGPFLDTEADKITQLMAVNVQGAMRTVQHVLPTMLQQGQGHIVNISSSAALIPTPGQTAYAPTRAAILAFSDALRREYAGHGLRVSTIMPGYVKTNMTENLDWELARESGLLPPLTKIAKPEDIAQKVITAVRHNTRNTLTGGLPFYLSAALHKVSPSLLDRLYPILGDPDKMTQALIGFRN